MTSQTSNTSEAPAQDGVATLPQEILDRLTRVDMPPVKDITASEETMQVAGQTLPIYRCETLVLGSGAAGLG